MATLTLTPNMSHSNKRFSNCQIVKLGALCPLFDRRDRVWGLRDGVFDRRIYFAKKSWTPPLPRILWVCHMSSSPHDSCSSKTNRGLIKSRHACKVRIFLKRRQSKWRRIKKNTLRRIGKIFISRFELSVGYSVVGTFRGQ